MTNHRVSWIIVGLILCVALGAAAPAQAMYQFKWLFGDKEEVKEKPVAVEKAAAKAAPTAGEGAATPPDGDAKASESADDAGEAKPEGGEAGDAEKKDGKAEGEGEGEGEEDDGLIQFNLKNAKIEQIMKFIGEQTQKPILKNKKVTATVTIAAPGRITPQQALDLLYDALRLEGFIVLESDERIQILPADEVKQQDILTVTWPLGEEMLDQRARFIRSIISLNSATATSMKAHLEPLLGKYAAITADDNTNKLLISDTVRNIERYYNIIKELDTISFDQNEVRIVVLKNAETADVYETVKDFVEQTFGKESKAPSEGGKAETPTVVLPLAKTNSILVSASVDRVKSITGLITQLDIKAPKEVDIYVIGLEFAKVRSVAQAVSQLFPQKRNQAEKDKVEIIDGGNLDAIVVVASEDNVAIIRKIVKELDTEKAQKRDTRRFQLKHLDAEDTAEELGNLYGSMKDSGNSYWSYYSSRYGNNQDDDKMKFVPIVRTNSILAIGPKSDFPLVESLIEEIDKPFNKEEVVPKVYQIKFSDAKSIEKVLNAVFGAGKDNQSYSPWYYPRSNSKSRSAIGRLAGKVNFIADENTNSIIVTTNNKANYAIVDEVIAELDQSFPEHANTMIYSLEHANATELAKELNSLFGTPVKPTLTPQEREQQAQDAAIERYYGNWGNTRKKDETPISNLIDRVRFVPDPRTNSLLITTASFHFPVIIDLIKQLDKQEPQVLIKVRILEIKGDKSKKLGLRWTPDASLVDPDDLDNALSVLGNLNVFDTFNRGDGIIDAGSNLNLILQLLIKNLDSEIVIDTMLYVNNNEEGEVFVGKKIPRLTNSQTTDVGGVTRGYTNEDIGVRLTAKPHINNQGLVVMKVHLETDQLTGETRFGSDVLQSREYKTEVTVHGGDTVVMGGIKLKNEQNTVRKIPLLGQIPGLGIPFRSKNKKTETSDLFVFITPIIVKSKEDAKQVTEEVQAGLDMNGFER